MCIFCKIVNREIPSYVLYEDADILAILDISQVTRGHTLILPKVHYDDFRQADDETLAKCVAVAKRLADALESTYAPLGFNLLTNCGEAAGQSVGHLHFHLIPRYDETDELTLRFKGTEKPNLQKIQANILKKK